MFAIGSISCDSSNHGRSISNIRVTIMVVKPYPPPYQHKSGPQPIRFLIGNYDEYKKEINQLVANGQFGNGDTTALFRFEPPDQFAFYVPMSEVTKAFAIYNKDQAHKRVHGVLPA